MYVIADNLTKHNMSVKQRNYKYIILDPGLKQEIIVAVSNGSLRYQPFCIGIYILRGQPEI